MARNYSAKNPWRKGSRQTEAEFDRIFFLMIRGASISQIAARMSKNELMVRDNYDYIVDHIVGHDLTIFLYAFIMQFIPLSHATSIRYCQEIAFWQRFPLHDDEALYHCSFRCSLSPSLSEIRNDGDDRDTSNLRAVRLKSNCVECPLKKPSGWESRNVNLDDHIEFLDFMKRYRDIRFNRRFVSSVRLFRTVKMMEIYRKWLDFISTQMPVEFVYSNERDRFMRYNLRKLETALKRVSLAAVAQRAGNHADLSDDFLDMDLEDRGGIDQARIAIKDTRYDLFHYKEMLNFSWNNCDAWKGQLTLSEIQFFLDREMARLARFKVVPEEGGLHHIGTKPI